MELESDIDLDPDAGEIENDPEAVAQRLAALGKVREGVELARQGKVEEAIALFKEAQKWQPNIDLTPDAEEAEKDPEVAAQKLAALAKLKHGAQLATQGKIEEALSILKQVQKFNPGLKITSNYWNRICWHGSLHGQATNVMLACEKAVALTPDDANIKDSRGLARALTGDIPGAIADFQAYVDWEEDDQKKVQRQGWIDSLKKGQNPFTPEVLESLLEE